MTPDWENTLEAMTLVLVRISGLMVFAPVFSSEAIPPRIKAGFVLAVSYLVAPVVAAFPRAHAELGILPVLGELSVGLLFGLTLSFLFEALQFTGQVMGFQFSFSLVNLMDPNAPVQIPLMGQLFGLLGTLTVLGAGLHRTMLAALFRTFATAPVGTVTLDPRASWALVRMAGGIFSAALQLSAPVLAATLLAELAVALAGKMSTQLPVMAMTVPVKTLLGYGVLIGSLALWPHWIEGHFAALLDDAGRLLAGAAGTA
ncbi:MAG TPA: flagellar biosynthetic protein FliR [Acidobacteriaceae bacterium]|jgi:flagellar biosynthetic protein FliR|nr:flagellar biosynthetic protein FliR [Acidobacteriaceae bacterium]